MNINNDILVTVITMTYNNFDRIYDTINSVMFQNYSNIEYIIADDCSNNFPRQRIEGIFNNSSIKVYKIIQNKKNVGTVKNATNACKMARGKYIMFLSCGDVFYEKDIVTRVVNRFEDTNSDLLAVRRLAFSGEYIPMFFLPHHNIIKKLNRQNNSLAQYNSYISTHTWDAVSGSALYYKKSILEEYGYFDDKYVLWEDGPFIEKYLRNNLITYAFDIIGIWYEYGGVSTNIIPNRILCNDCILFDRTDRLFKRNELSSFYRHYVDYIYHRTFCTNKKQILMLALKYPFVILSSASYNFQKKILRYIDKKYVAKQKINRPVFFKER